MKIKKERGATIQPRVVVPNDTKMFGQASCESDIRYFISADSEAKKVYDLLIQPDFVFIDIQDNEQNILNLQG